MTDIDKKLRPAWELCPDCDEFWCNIHKEHACDCKCPPLDDWIDNPYGHNFVIKGG